MFNVAQSSTRNSLTHTSDHTTRHTLLIGQNPLDLISTERPSNCHFPPNFRPSVYIRTEPWTHREMCVKWECIVASSSSKCPLLLQPPAGAVGGLHWWGPHGGNRCSHTSAGGRQAKLPLTTQLGKISNRNLFLTPTICILLPNPSPLS